MTGGALPVFVDSVRAYSRQPEDEAAQQLLRQTLWAFPTWLANASLQHRSMFIRHQALAALLEVR